MSWWPFVSKRKYDALRRVLMCERRVNNMLWEKNDKLAERLAKALRNDTPRDPKTGKFVKRDGYE